MQAAQSAPAAAMPTGVAGAPSHRPDRTAEARPGAAPRRIASSVLRSPLRLVAVIALFTIGPLILLSTLSVATSTNNAVNSGQDQLASASQLAALYVDKEMMGLVGVVDSYARRSTLVVAMADGNHLNYDRATLITQLDELRRQRSEIASALVFDADMTFWGVGSPASTQLAGRNYSFRDYYSAVLSTKAPYVSSAHVSETGAGPLVVSIAAPINKASDLVGLLVAEVSLAGTQSMVTDFAHTQGLALEVTDQNGIIVAQPDNTPAQLVRDYAPIAVHALRGQATVTRRSIDGIDYFEAGAPATSIGWTVIARIKATDSLAAANRLAAYVEWITAALVAELVVVMVILYLVLRDRQAAYRSVELANVQLERRVQARTSELEALNRDLDAFTYSVSHDLRAPLRALTGFSNLLSSRYADTLGAEGKQYTERIASNASKMGRLIDELLRLSRLGRTELRIRCIDPAAVVATVLEDLKDQIVSGAIDMHVASNMPPCWADADMLQQVYVNLISNAVKFTRARPDARIEVGYHNESGQVVYDVTDNGVGFDMQYADKLFGVFQRLHPQTEFEGTGVGLAIVRRIVELHGGRVWAEGEVGKGASFHFSLPGR